MHRFIKYGLWSVGTVAAIILAGIVYIAATFNPNDYKAQIIQFVQDKQQRTLRLDGDIKLGFFPSIYADLGKVSLSEFQSDKEFLSIDSVRVSLALLPLLSKQIVVDEVAASGIKASMVKTRGGKSSIDDLISKSEAPSSGQPLSFDIASVRIDKTELVYLDETTGEQYALKNLNLKTGRITAGVPVKIDFDAVLQADKPKLDIAARLQAMLTFDLENQLYQLEEMKLHAKGSALGLNDLVLQASGNASAKLTTQEFTAEKLLITAGGLQGTNRFDAKLNAPELSLTKNRFAGEKLTLDASLAGTMGDINAAFALHDLTGNAQLFKSSAFVLELDIRQPDQAFKVKLDSPVSGNFEQQQLNFSNVTLAVNAIGVRLPNKSISSEMKGSVQIDGSRQSAQANLAGGLLQSQVKARVGVNNFTRPAIRFDIEADQFDADLYLPGEAAGADNAKKSAAAAEQPLDLSVLKELNLKGGLRIGMFKIANIRLAQLRLDAKANNGLLKVNPLSANLYQGSTNGSLSINAQATPEFTIVQNMKDVNIAPLLHDIAGLDMLEGRGNVSLNLSAQGNTTGMLKKGLNGEVGLNLADGAIRGINITKLVRDVQALGKGETTQIKSISKDERTDFSEFKASFRVRNGVAHNDDLSVKSQLLRLTGKGDINIAGDSVNYTARATLAKSPDGQGGTVTVPVHLSGPFADLKYKLDFGAMLSDAARQKVEEKKEQIKSRAQEKLKSKLRDLLK